MNKTETTKPKAAELESYIVNYPHINPEVIVKSDILIRGLRFTPAGLKSAQNAKRKSYYLFSFDRATSSEVGKDVYFGTPEDIRISGGPYRLRPTILQVRLSTDSPYLIDAPEGKPVLLADGANVADVEFTPKPKYDDLRLSDGSRCGEIAPTTGWNWLVFVTCLRVCQYWGPEEECRFCDINANFRQQKAAGREYTGLKKVDTVAEALENIFVAHKETDPQLAPHSIVFTGGTITKNVAGKGEVDFYTEYVSAARERIGARPTIILQTNPHLKEGCKRMKEAGVDFHHPNIEVWDKRLFEAVCPGKARFVGWDEWVRRTIDSVDVFGEGNVNPNFVIGVEMARPWGFESIDDAVASTTQGIDFFMSHGVVPRLSPWLIEPTSALKGHALIPLDYFLKVTWNWYGLLKYYRLLPPPGLGPFGPGRSRYHTSAYFDIDDPRYGVPLPSARA